MQNNISNIAYERYWERKQALAASPQHFALKRWWRSKDLSEIESCYFEAIKNRSSVLDVGAGDLRVRDKLVRAGFHGLYHTMDIGAEYEHTYHTLDDVSRTYSAIICLDVIEHMTLSEGLGMLSRFVELLDKDGVIIVQTPNGKCIRNPMGWDMTHLHIYNLPDLWAHFKSYGFDVTGHRVWFTDQYPSSISRFKMLLNRLVVTRIIGSDYADNIAIIAQRGIKIN